jgi:cellulose synthase/poly-beta-1,6-N-acetylglucosamine synthase-like glycosyltransferase
MAAAIQSTLLLILFRLSSAIQSRPEVSIQVAATGHTGRVPVFFRIAQVLDWLIALSWLTRVLVWRRMLHRVPDLTRTVETHLALPLLSVIVPARNEAASIAATLRSLLAADGVNLQILAVNDRSSDQTGAIMERLAVEGGTPNKTLQILHITELPAGWLGKTHAMALAAQHATGEWLLFTDGDVLFRPDALRRAIEYATSSGADHLVLLPTILLRSWGERMLVAFLQVLSIWALRPWRVADPAARRDSIGVGAFNLIRRSAYDALGGWEALRMEIVEDLALGRRVKTRGFAQRAVLGLDLVGVRWAQGAFGVVDNLTKNLFAVFHFRPELLLGFVCGLALFTLFPLAACLAGPALWWPTGLMLIALFLAYQQMGRYQHFSSAQMPLYPVAAVLLLYALLRSMCLALWHGGVSWRGTFYSLRELRQQSKRPIPNQSP